MSKMTLLDKHLVLCSQHGQPHAQSQYWGFSIIQAVLDACAVSAGIGLSRNASSVSSTRKEEERCGSCGKTLCSCQMRKIKKRRRPRQKEQGHSRRTCCFCSSRSLISSLVDRVVCGRKGRARVKDDQSIAKFDCSVLKWSSVRTPFIARLDHRYTFPWSGYHCMAFLYKSLGCKIVVGNTCTQDAGTFFKSKALVRESSCQLFRLKRSYQVNTCCQSAAAWR